MKYKIVRYPGYNYKLVQVTEKLITLENIIK